jgi:serine-type D-Ala-D-Ala carboxypeptidase (penicillin-binding protein 5/6)
LAWTREVRRALFAPVLAVAATALGFAALGGMATTARAAAPTPAVAAPAAVAVPADPLASAATHIAIMDYDTGLLLYCKHCNEPMPPASMSKLMTVLVVADKIKSGALKLDTMLPVSENAWRHGAQSDGSHMFLELNSQVSVRDLMAGVIIVSANDACIVLAEGISGSEAAFVDEMNKKAKELGLKTAHFANATGLPDPNHLISAADLARLSAHLIKSDPELYKLYATADFTYNNHTQQNRNPILGHFPGADGLKTGHTDASGYGMIGSAQQNGVRRLVVFNGMPSMAARSAEGQRLMRAAFDQFKVVKLYAKGDTVGEAQVWMGGKPSAPLVAPNDINVGFLRSAQNDMKAAIVYQGPMPAPVKEGQPIAELVIDGPGAPPEKYPLVAGNSVSRMSWFGRAIFGARRMFSGDK